MLRSWRRSGLGERTLEWEDLSSGPAPDAGAGPRRRVRVDGAGEPHAASQPSRAGDYYGAPVSPVPRMITTGDDNQTVVVGLGEYLVLALDSGFDWSGVEISDPSVLQAVAGATPPAGPQGVYYAGRAREATLSATGSVHCTPNVSCPQLARLFRVTIRVRG